MPKKKQTLEEGFEKFVIRNSEGCWDWKGCCPKNPGYGQFRVNMKSERAHRASWIIHYGKIPSGYFVCHTCDNKRCSNPKHLFLGTCKENNLDAINKNLHPNIGKKRDDNHKTKVFTKDFRDILSLYKMGFSQSLIGKLYDVNQFAIWKVISKSQGVAY